MVTPRTTIQGLLHPASVAVIGAAEEAEKWGGRVMLHLMKHGFRGRIAPVNARRSVILGRAAYATIGDVPRPVDVAVIVVPAAAAVDAVRDCAEAGVGACVIITANFAEVGGEGLDRERTIAGIARRSGMRLVGPNCLGLINAPHHTALSPSLALSTMTHLPAGGVGLVSQSGALMGSLLIRGFDLGAGFSACVSVGNQADLELCDFFEYLIDDPATRVIGLYIEGLRDAGRFVTLARRAQERGKPVLAAKAGRTQSGARAVQSHTASLAGSHAVFEAVCAAYGVVLVPDALDLLPCAEVIVRHGRARADGIAVLSGSGGSGALWTDAVAESGLRLGRLAAGTRTALGAVLPATHADLPIDLGVMDQTRLPRDETMEQIVSAVMADPDIGAGLYMMTTQPDMEGAARVISRAGEKCGKPLLFVNAAGSSGDGARRTLRERRYLCFDAASEALRALQALVSDYTLREAYAARRADPPRAPAGTVPDLGALPAGPLSETDASALLSNFGIPVVRGGMAATAEEAAEQAARIGYPVALKGSARGLVHKSDAHAVRLDLRDAAEVRAAFDETRAAITAFTAAQCGPGGFRGCLVQAMVKGDAELILGAHHDEQFGAIFAIGFGGALVELVRDVRLLPLPLTRSDVLRALRGLRCLALLEGYRGRGAADLDRIADVALRLAALAVHLGPRLQDLEINPLMVRGSEVAAVDVRVTIRA
jgi:acyl-CoA synthetase (NDP forming)